MKIAITGSTGLIGTALVPHLRDHGHEVLRLVRRPPAEAGEVRWDPSTGTVDVEGLAGVEGVVHLAGAGVADHRWTDAYKRVILDSRVSGTTTIATVMAALDPLPRVLVSGSAVGFYGNAGDTVLDESSPMGDSFLADVVARWEAAGAPASAAGIRVCFARTGIVLSPQGGALGRMLPLFRAGLGGRLRNGRQWWPWISLEDEVRALAHLLEHDVSGPVNLVGPTPATNAEVTASLGTVLGRPTVAQVPAFALKIALGELSSDILGSQRLTPSVLLADGFSFTHPDVLSALRASV